MGTRASIKFKDDYEEFFTYRGHDGHPENILPDIQATIDKGKGRWSGSEIGLLVTLFLAIHYDYEKSRLPDYEITSCRHGDEAFDYLVEWSGDKWVVTYE